MNAFYRFFCSHETLEIKRRHVSTATPESVQAMGWIDELGVSNSLRCTRCGKLFGLEVNEPVHGSPKTPDWRELQDRLHEMMKVHAVLGDVRDGEPLGSGFYRSRERMQTIVDSIIRR